MGAKQSTLVPEAYSLWVAPAEKDLRRQLQREINTLAKDHGAPRFGTHLGFLGNIVKPKAEVIAIAKLVAAQLKSFPVQFLQTDHGNMFWRSVYLLCEKGEELEAAVALARKMYEMPAAWPFLAHVSLLYADLTEEQAVAAQEAARLRLFGDGAAVDEESRCSCCQGPNVSSTRLTATSFTVTALQVWYTPSEDKTLKSWRRVKTFPLAQRGGSGC